MLFVELLILGEMGEIGDCGFWIGEGFFLDILVFLFVFFRVVLFFFGVIVFVDD